MSNVLKLQRPWWFVVTKQMSTTRYIVSLFNNLDSSFFFFSFALYGVSKTHASHSHYPDSYFVTKATLFNLFLRFAAYLGMFAKGSVQYP